MEEERKRFLPYQIAWIKDQSPLKLMEKSRQGGMTLADTYDSVRKVSVLGARLNVWVSSRDEQQARLDLEDCKEWGEGMQMGAEDLGEGVFEEGSGQRA